jgi:protein-tyrosine-phosphatase
MPQAVLFMCNRNAIRSPMAAAILHFLAGRRIYSRSAGIRPGEADPFAVAVMDEVGIDMSAHAPASIEELDDGSFDLIITLSPEAHHKALELTRTMAVDVEYWPTLDPSVVGGSREQILDNYRALRETLFRRIKARFDLLAAPQA